MPNEPSRDEITALRAGEFLDWYNQLGAELEAEASELQQQVAANPRLLDDPDFQEREAKLRGKKELLQQAGEDFSNHTMNKMGSFLIEKAFEGEDLPDLDENTPE